MSATTVPGQELTLDIESPAAGGTVIARHEGRVVFVRGAIPGERVRVRTEADATAKFLRAEVTEVLSASPHRVADRRLEFVSASVPGDGPAQSEESSPALFGGMEFAHVDLAHSRRLKAEVVHDQLARIGRIHRDVEVSAAPGETDGMGWRTRVQLAVDDNGRIGMLAPRSHEVVPVTSAPLACGPLSEVELGDLRVPGLRRLEFAWAGDDGALIVRGEADSNALDALTATLPEQWSILAEASEATERAPGARGGDVRSGHAKTNGRRGGPRGRGRAARGGGENRHGRADRALRVVRGHATLTETVNDATFNVAAEGFWQVHRQAAALLSDEVIAAMPAATSAITDLYCGVGLLGIRAARATGASLFGVEGVQAAIENARVNGAGLNARFETLKADRAEIPGADVIILDPPRAGAGKTVIRTLIESSARTVVYVSCDAATLARDLAGLQAGGFVIVSLKGFDLFPLTAHVETVTVLRR